MRLLGYSGWLRGCWYAVARVLVVIAMVSGGVARQLVGYPGRSLRCCYVVARVVRVVARLV